MNVDRAFHWLRSSTPLDIYAEPGLDDDDLLDDLIDDLLDEDDIDDDPADSPSDDDFGIPCDDLEDANEVPDDEDEFEARGGTPSATPAATNTTLVAYLVCDADQLGDAAGAAAFLRQLCGEGGPRPTTVIASDRGSTAARFVAAALGLRLQTLGGLRPFDPDVETSAAFDDRCRDALETIQSSAGGLPVIVGSASLTAYMAGVDVTDPRDSGAFSLVSSGGVLAITTRGIVLLHRPSPAACTDCAQVDLPCPFHDDMP